MDYDKCLEDEPSFPKAEESELQILSSELATMHDHRFRTTKGLECQSGRNQGHKVRYYLQIAWCRFRDDPEDMFNYTWGMAVLILELVAPESADTYRRIGVQVLNTHTGIEDNPSAITWPKRSVTIV